ncbi:hypothetical protein AeMF1_006844 [Aphanomyces euteiches]|nr:hypothetical protein AeMF1_006844 [Aphanomyces euteiches]
MSVMRKTEDANPSLPEDDGGPWDFEDEPAPVGVAEDRMRTLRLMPVEPLTIFDGEFSDRDTVGTWLRKFEVTSYACQWSDEETRRRFRLYTTKYVQGWVSQLEGPQKRTWRQLRQSFMKEYVQSAIDQEDLYYCMYQKPHEKVRAYFVRLNAAALRIGVDYRKSRRHLDRHIDRFARTLYDRSLGMAISRQHFQSIVDLERFVDRMRKSEEIDEFMGKSYPLNRPTTAPPMNPQDRTKAKKGNVQFIDTSYDRMPAYESPPPSPTASRAEIFALGRNYGSARKIKCSECGREHYSVDGQCWANVYCVLCNKMGHPDSNCFKACPICVPPHNKYERCEKREKIAELKTFLEAHGIDNMPSLECLNV